MQLLNVLILVIGSCSLTINAAAVTDWSPAVNILMKTYSTCQKDGLELWPCLKQRALAFIERASTLSVIPIVPGITVEKDSSESSEALHDAGTHRAYQLDDLLWHRAASFLQTHSLRVKFPAQTGDVEEGRGKMKKLAGPLLLALMMKGMLGALAVGALALLAGKALLVSKMALMLALILTLKKLLSGGGSHHETYEIVAKHPVHHHEGSSSNHVTSVAEPSPGYFGRKRSFHASATTTSIPKTTNSADAANYNVYDSEDYAQMKAYRGHRANQHA